MHKESSIHSLLHTFRSVAFWTWKLSVFFLLPLKIFSGTTGILEGTVKDKESSLLLPGASIMIQELRLGGSTDANGYFQLNNIRAGMYTVKVSMIGYQAQSFTNIRILPDRRTKLSIELLASSIELHEMEIHAERPLIETNITGTVHTFDADRIGVLPVSSMQDVLKWQVGVTQEGNVRGGRTDEVLYLVDGLPIQDVLGGGSGSILPRSSIVQMSMSTGGFDAEYGNALSGVVNVVTRSGGEKAQSLLRVDNDSFYGGKQNDHASDIELTLSGPVKKERLFYFLSANLFYTDTRYWQDFREFYDSPVSRDWSGFGKLDWRSTGGSTLTGSFLFSSQKWHDYEFSWRFNLTGLPLRTRDSYRGALQYTSNISSTAFFTAQISHYYLGNGVGQGTKEELKPVPYDYDFLLRYIVDGARSWWSRTKQRLTTLKGDYSVQWDKNNLLRAGAEFQQYAINADLLRYEPQKTYFGKPILTAPMLNYSTAYTYDPRAGSVFIQNKFEVNKTDGLINVGLRFDFLDPRAERPVVDTVPVGGGNYEQRVVKTTAASMKYKFSPRIGISAPISPTAFIFINYGEYFQYPLFDYLYSGLDPQRIANGVRAVLGNPDLEPERTKAWEISVRYNFFQDLVCSATYFSKQSKNLIDTKTFLPTNSRIAGDYGFVEYVNNPEANASGFEFTLSRQRGSFVTGDISYTYSETKGVSEYVNQGLNYAQWGFPLAPEEYYLSWDQRHAVKANVQASLPWGIKASLLYQYSSGKPYTYFPSNDGVKSVYPVEYFTPNNRRMDANNFLDLKLMREFSFTAGLRNLTLTFYGDIRNVFNTKNVLWVDSSGKIGGELEDVTAYYSPRRARLGVTVAY